MADLRLVGYQSFSESDKRIVGVRTIEEAEFENLAKAIREMFQFSAHQSLYALCQRNHAELTATWGDFERQYGRSGEFNEAALADMSIELNRRLLNYLTTFRTFIDHWKKTLRSAKRAGRDSGYSAKFEKAISGLESRCFEFNFSGNTGTLFSMSGCRMPHGSSRLVPLLEQRRESFIPVRCDWTAIPCCNPVTTGRGQKYCCGGSRKR